MTNDDRDVTVHTSGGGTNTVAIIAIIVILVLVIGAYLLFFQNPGPGAPANQPPAGDVNVQLEDGAADEPDAAQNPPPDVNIQIQEQEQQAAEDSAATAPASP